MCEETADAASAAQKATNLRRRAWYECKTDTNYDGERYYENGLRPPSYLQVILAQKSLTLQGIFWRFWQEAYKV